jgi:hypothetical protein
MPTLAGKLGVNIITTNVFGPDHVIHTVAEADNSEAVRELVMQSRLAQRNKTQIYATWSMEEPWPRLINFLRCSRTAPRMGRQRRPIRRRRTSSLACETARR